MKHHPATAVDMFTPTTEFDGETFARIDGQWCQQTQTGTWRPASYFHGNTRLVDRLLDHINKGQP